jgi:hypothetical protein
MSSAEKGDLVVYIGGWDKGQLKFAIFDRKGQTYNYGRIFDKYTGRFNEKIQNIGDNYLIIAGTREGHGFEDEMIVKVLDQYNMEM